MKGLEFNFVDAFGKIGMKWNAMLIL
ncbi:hypothetical protein bas62_0186 [Escherichia phage JohannJBalmer]|nr:hypothetical protein bas62_0186 [Escherichia phage JohannJBalmer]